MVVPPLQLSRILRRRLTQNMSNFLVILAALLCPAVSVASTLRSVSPLETPAVRQALLAGLEEREPAGPEEWTDLRWFWEKLSPQERQRLLHGMPGSRGFYLNSWRDLENFPEEQRWAPPGVTGLMEGWLRFVRADSAAFRWHVDRGDLFRHLTQVEFADAPFADPFRRSVEAISRTPGTLHDRTARLIAYLNFLRFADVRRPYDPLFSDSLKRTAEALSGYPRYCGWSFLDHGGPNFDELIGIFFERHRESLNDLGKDLEGFLVPDRVQFFLKLKWFAARELPLVLNEGRFERQLLNYLLGRPEVLGEPCLSLWSPDRTTVSAVRAQLSQGKISELDAVLILIIASDCSYGREWGSSLPSWQWIWIALERGLLKKGEVSDLASLLNLERGERLFLYGLMSKAVAVFDENPRPLNALLEVCRYSGSSVLGSKVLFQPGYRYRLKEVIPWLASHMHGREWVPFLRQALLYQDDNGKISEAAMDLLRVCDPEILPRLAPEILECWSLNGLVWQKAFEVVCRMQPAFRSIEEPRVARAALAFYPHWLEQPPSTARMARFIRAISYLPPVGGKVYRLSSASDGTARLSPLLLPPFRTAEEQVQTLVNARRRRLLTEGYVQQIAVQGRMTDDFKWMALAFIVSSPYSTDWRKPFFNAAWGQIAPMIHDGGSEYVDAGLAPGWKNPQDPESDPGRTDFIQRVVVVYEANLEDWEKLSPEERRKQVGEDPDLPRRIELERKERDRLRVEDRAYQRLAAAFHAAHQTMPEGIPPELVARLAARWEEFKKELNLEMGQFLGPEFRDALLLPPWFLDTPRHTFLHARYEADWPPIQEQLLRLSDFADKNPELYRSLRWRVRSLLNRMAQEIDAEIGLAEFQMEEEVQQVRRELHASEVRGPAGAFFFGFVPPAAEPGSAQLVNDWELLREEVAANPRLRGITLVKVELRPGETPAQRAREITGEYALAGDQMTAGFALGVVPDEQAKECAGTPSSFLYIPEEAQQGVRNQGRFFRSPFVSQFLSWAADPTAGVWPVVPEATLPEMFRQLFENQMRSQAGLEMAA